jgi:hypothetical protein
MACAMLVALDGRADVYVWKDPQTGSTRMTNVPPPWVRSPPEQRRTPKVEVIRGSKVMDPATAAAPLQPEARAKPSARAEQDDDDRPTATPGVSPPDSALVPPFPAGLIPRSLFPGRAAPVK